MTAQKAFGSSTEERELVKRWLRRQPLVEFDGLCPADRKWLLKVYEELVSTGNGLAAAPPVDSRPLDLQDDQAWDGFVKLLAKEFEKKEVFRPLDRLDPDLSSAGLVTVPVLFVEPESQSGKVANLSLQLVSGSGKAFRHPSLAFIDFDESWLKGIEAALNVSNARGEWRAREDLRKVDLVWNLILQDGKGLPVASTVGGPSAAAAFDLGLYLLANPEKRKRYAHIAVTAGIEGGQWTEVKGYLPKLREAWEKANPAIQFILVVKLHKKTAEFEQLISGYQPHGDSVFVHHDQDGRRKVVVEALKLEDALTKIGEFLQLKDWTETFGPQATTDDLLCQEEIVTRIQEEEERLSQSKGQQIFWLHGPPGSGKTCLLSLWYEALLSSGKPPFYHSCQPFVPAKDVVHELERQVAEWNKLYLTLAEEGVQRASMRGAKHRFILDGVDNIHGDLHPLEDFIKRHSHSTWVVSSIHKKPQGHVFWEKIRRTASIDDFCESEKLARTLLTKLNDRLAEKYRLNDDFIAEVLQGKPTPMAIVLCCQEIEDGNPEPRQQASFWSGDIREMVKKRLVRLVSKSGEVSGAEAPATGVLAALTFLVQPQAESLCFDEETIERLTGQRFQDFQYFSQIVSWLFVNDSLEFAHPSFVYAVRSLWAKKKSLAEQEARKLLAGQCHKTLRNWLDKAVVNPSVQLLPVEEHALRHTAHYLFNADNMGNEWADMLLDWEYLRQRYRRHGALALLAAFPDFPDIGMEKGMNDDRVSAVSHLREIIKGEQTFLDARREELRR